MIHARPPVGKDPIPLASSDASFENFLLRPRSVSVVRSTRDRTLDFRSHCCSLLLVRGIDYAREYSCGQLLAAMFRHRSVARTPSVFGTAGVLLLTPWRIPNIRGHCSVVYIDRHPQGDLTGIALKSLSKTTHFELIENDLLIGHTSKHQRFDAKLNASWLTSHVKIKTVPTPKSKVPFA